LGYNWSIRLLSGLLAGIFNYRTGLYLIRSDWYPFSIFIELWLAMATYLSSVIMIMSSEIAANVFGRCNNFRIKVA